MRLLKKFIRLWLRLVWPIFYVGTPTKPKIVSHKSSDSSTKPKTSTTVPTTSASDAKSVSQETIVTGAGTLSASVGPTMTSKSPSEEDSRIGWIHTLNKEQLRFEMQRYDLNIEGNVEELRKRFVKFWKEGIPRPTTLPVEVVRDEPYMSVAGSVEYQIGASHNRPVTEAFVEARGDTVRHDAIPQMTNAYELDRVKEILGVAPNTSFEAVCRKLTELSFKGPTPHNPELTLPLRVPECITHPTSGGMQYDAPLRPGALDRRFRQAAGSPVSQRETTSHGEISSICNVVRKWNIRFDGRRDPISFLERLEELMEAYDVDRVDLLKALPELLHSTALLWYRNGKDSWRTYEDFRGSFELQFLPPEYRRNLDEEIRRRTQGDNEAFRNFVVALTTLMRRRGGLSVQQRLDIIYSNMRPDYKMTMRRQDFYSLEDMLRQAEHVESYFREKALFRAPPPPSMSLIPETAYNPKTANDKNRRGFHSVNLVDRDNSSYETKSVRFMPRVVEKQHESRMANVTRRGQPSIRQLGPNRSNSAEVSGRSECSAENEMHDNREQERAKYSDLVCWNCEKTGHMFRNCRLTRVIRCFHCKKEGVKTHHCRCRAGNARRTRGELGGYLSPERNPQ